LLTPDLHVARCRCPLTVEGGVLGARLEQQEQEIVVAQLRAAGLLFCAVPNGLYTSRAGAAAAVRAGLVKGAPDLLIFSAPPGAPGARGVALEMKRSERGRVSPEQASFLAALEREGWVVLVGRGADAALTALVGLGYNVRGPVTGGYTAQVIGVPFWNT
jgi:hypothetical protein